MEIRSYEGKTEAEALEKALAELNLTESDVLFRSEEKKGKLFKASTIELKVLPLSEVEEYAKEYLKNLLTDMGIEVSFESRIREKQIYLKMYSNNNPVLIGKNGQTLEALQTIIKSIINKSVGLYPVIILDVENYKEKQEKRIENLAKNTAREVLKTKVEARLENMNSYERRIVHNILTDYKGIYTVSEGEEPNRYVVIKIKEDK
jgi:spoIIIJ-associated protein